MVDDSIFFLFFLLLLSNDFICCFWFEILTWEEESGKAISVVCDMGKGLSK